jgi:hypothetical protein
MSSQYDDASNSSHLDTQDSGSSSPVARPVLSLMRPTSMPTSTFSGISGIGMWNSWERNFTSTLLAALDLIDNAMDATMNSPGFHGKIHIYGDVDMLKDEITGLCIKNNCNNAPKNIEQVLEAYSSSKGAHAIGENGIGVKQACAAISELSFVCIKNKNKIGLGVLAKSLQTEKASRLPSCCFNEDTLESELLLLVRHNREWHHCMLLYGNGDLSYGQQRILKHLQELSNWGGEPYVFLVVVNKCRGKDGPFKLMETLESELPRQYLHVPDDFDVQINQHPVVFQYWERRLVELHKFCMKIDPVNSWRTADDWADPEQFNEYNLFIGFDPNRKKDDKKASLLIHSRKSGRLIRRHADSRGILYLENSGTSYAQGLTIILDDYRSMLPLTPTKQDLAFSNEGSNHEDNLYHWMGAYAQLYYMYFLGKYTPNGRKAELGALVASAKPQIDALVAKATIDKPLLLGNFSTLVTCLPTGVLEATISFKKSNAIRCSNKMNLKSIDGPDTLVNFARPARAGRPTPTKKQYAPQSTKKRRRSEDHEEEKEPGGPRPGMFDMSLVALPLTLSPALPSQQRQNGTMETLLGAKVAKSDRLLQARNAEIAKLRLQVNGLKDKCQRIMHEGPTNLDESYANPETVDALSRSKDEEIARLNSVILQLRTTNGHSVGTTEGVVSGTSEIQTQLVFRKYDAIIQELRTENEKLRKMAYSEDINDLKLALANKEILVQSQSQLLNDVQNALSDASRRLEEHASLFPEIADLRRQNSYLLQELLQAKAASAAQRSVAEDLMKQVAEETARSVHVTALTGFGDDVAALQQENRIMKEENRLLKESRDKARSERAEFMEKTSQQKIDLKGKEAALEEAKRKLGVSEDYEKHFLDALKAVEAERDAARVELEEMRQEFQNRGSPGEEKKETATVEEGKEAEIEGLKKTIDKLNAEVEYYRGGYEAELAQKHKLEKMMNLR